MLARHPFSRLLAATIGVVILVVGNTVAQDIVNPILFHYEMSSEDGTVDTLLSARVTFDPLPQYGVQTNLTIEHYARFSTDSGMMVELRGEAVEKVWLHAPYYAKRIPGPIKKGDTVRVEFQLTLHQVGMIPLSLLVYDDLVLAAGKSVRVGVMEEIPFLLSADGQTVGMASRSVSQRNATVLGPVPNLLAGDRVFRIQPHYPQPDLQWLDLPERPNYEPDKNVFDLEVRLRPVVDKPGQRRVICRVSPHQDFEYGIAWQITHSDELAVTGVDSCILGEVWADSLYELSCDLELVSSGLGKLIIHCITPNPDNGVEGALFSNRPPVIGAEISLTLGVGESLEPVLVTDTPLKLYLRAAQEAGLEAETLDQRFAFVEKYQKDEYETHTIEGPQFKFVMVHVKP
ncbi:MAG: hypothetical protein GY867_02060 [bacterium]|nr:hypothetical protein [bacterium]